ncbi:hypothetical protein FISHEDRAFT_57902 [Fistulina hepatica ATCC 64428]|uniref:Uncharacterized protein n=1 Tax=Fistulina hepatica ATCC 64428 TaxID=1128425 RepID=A0A0D7AH23_9AGAR|nr:hypothetical protein FISHEDRAFT_57902 [Fistulina hepatica ATCC 64428]
MIGTFHCRTLSKIYSPAIDSLDHSSPRSVHDRARRFINGFVLPHVMHQGPVVPATGWHEATECSSRRDDCRHVSAPGLCNLQGGLSCEVILVAERVAGPTDLYDRSLLDESETGTILPTESSNFNGLDNGALILHIFGTSDTDSSASGMQISNTVVDGDGRPTTKGRGQKHPLPLLVPIIPIFFFCLLKAGTTLFKWLVIGRLSGRGIFGMHPKLVLLYYLLLGAKIGKVVKMEKKTVMGSGALGKRGTLYEDGSTWIGNDDGEAICLGKGSSKDKESSIEMPVGRAFYKRQAPYFVRPCALILIINTCATSWSMAAVIAAQVLCQFQMHCRALHLFGRKWYTFGILYGLIALFFVIIVAGLVVLVVGYALGGVLVPLAGSAYIVWYYRLHGCKIGKDSVIFASGSLGLVTEPDLVEIDDHLSVDDCSVVAHINSRGNFILNRLKIGNGSAMRTGSRLLSGAPLENNSMLCEHTLLTSGQVAEETASIRR